MENAYLHYITNNTEYSKIILDYLTKIESLLLEIEEHLVTNEKNTDYYWHMTQMENTLNHILINTSQLKLNNVHLYRIIKQTTPQPSNTYLENNTFYIEELQKKLPKFRVSFICYDSYIHLLLHKAEQSKAKKTNLKTLLRTIHFYNLTIIDTVNELKANNDCFTKHYLQKIAEIKCNECPNEILKRHEP